MKDTSASPTASSGEGTDEVSIDEIDRKLIARLERNPRATYAELAEGVEISSVAVATRVRRLREVGVVVIGAILEAPVFGSGLPAALLVEVHGRAIPVAQALAAIPEATFIALASGSAAVHVEIRCADEADLIRVLDDVRATDGVSRVEVFTYLDVTKEYSSPRRTPARMEFDDVDRHLISLLQTDGRATFASLAGAVGIAPSTVGGRVNRLLESGVIVIVTMVAPAFARPRAEAGVFATIVGDTREVALHLASLEEITFVALTTGSRDLLLTCTMDSRRELATRVDELRSAPGLRNIQVFEYLSIIKEDYRLAASARGSRTESIAPQIGTMS